MWTLLELICLYIFGDVKGMGFSWTGFTGVQDVDNTSLIMITGDLKSFENMLELGLSGSLTIFFKCHAYHGFACLY